MGADQKQTCVTPAHKWQRTSILLTASAQRRKTSFSSFTPPLQSYSSSPLSSTLLMGPLCHLLVYSVLSRYPPGSLLLYYLVRNSALCVVCVRPLSGLLYCKKELMCNWRPKVWTSEVAVTSVCYCCGWVQHFTTTENHLQHGWTIGSGRSHYSTSQVSRPYGNSAFAPSHREDKGRLWEKMGVKLPVVEELSVGVRGLFQLLSISRRKNIKKCESKIDIKESFQQQHRYYIYYIIYTHRLPGPAESLTAERLQSQATSGLPCIHFTAQALINYQTHTVTEAAVRLAPLSNKPTCIQC